MTASVFGLAATLDVSVCSLALLGVVAFTVVFESLTHLLEHKLAGSPYLDMLTKVYKG